MKRMGCLTVILVLAIVCLDQYRIEQMRSQVNAISYKLHMAQSQTRMTRNASSDLVFSVSEAKKHTKRAKELLKEKKNAAAEAELDKAMNCYKSADDNTKNLVGNAASFMGKAKDNAVKVFKKAWTDISDEANAKKQDVAR